MQMQDKISSRNLALKYMCSHLKFVCSAELECAEPKKGCIAKLSCVDKKENTACCTTVSSILSAICHLLLW